MQPYSLDFRKKIIEVREQENISIRKLAERFKVAKSFVQKLLLKRTQETGDISQECSRRKSTHQIKQRTISDFSENN